MNTKLEQYKVFNEAATTLSFSIAARNLFISQSAVSQTISSLEKELQTQLFIRLSKGVTLTKEGTLLYKKINHALNLITTAENQISNLLNLKDGELYISAGDTISEIYLTPYIIKFNQLYPNVKIKVINRTSTETVELLKSNQIDLGFINMPIENESLKIKECYKIDDIFISKTKSDYVYDYKDIASMPLILLENSSNTRNYIDNIFSKNGILLNPIIELGSHNLLLEYVYQGLGIAVVSKQFSSRYLENNMVYELKLKHPLPQRSIGYAYRKRKVLSQATIKFIEILNDGKSFNDL